MDANTIAQVLEGALRILDGGKNWIQNDYRAGRFFCLAGACCESAIRLDVIKEDERGVFFLGEDEYGLDFESTADELVTEISLTSLVKEEGYLNVPRFNDTKGRTYDDIRLLVERRLALLREASV